MCPGKELANVPREWDYPMCHVNGTSQCALGMGLSNVHLGMGLANVPWEWDYPMCPGNETSPSALGMGISNVPWEWD